MDKNDTNKPRPPDDMQSDTNKTSIFQDLKAATGISFKKKEGDKGVINHTESTTNSHSIQNDELRKERTVEIKNSKPENNDISSKRSKKKKALLFGSIIAVMAIAILLAQHSIRLLLEPKPPEPDVVATYNNKNITSGELLEFIRMENIRTGEHYICKEHGFDHSKCDEFEECEVHPIHSLEAYQQVLQLIAVNDMILEWADDNSITQREDVSHGLKDLVDDMSVDSIISQLRVNEISPESISKWEVQQYFDKNKNQYEGAAFSDVEDEIRDTLASQKDEEFFPAYIEELKQTAGLQVNFELLRVTEPTEADLMAYYDKNVNEFKSLDKAKGIVITIGPVSDELWLSADTAYSKIQAGQSYAEVAAQYSINGVAEEKVLELASDKSYSQQLIAMKSGDVALPFEYQGNIILFKFSELVTDDTKSYSNAKDDIRKTLLLKNMESEYSLRKDDALFTVHGNRYTLGNFYTELTELPEEYQSYFLDYESKKALVEQLIVKELLLEQYTDDTQSDDDAHRMEDLKQQYLSQIYHQEMVDGQIEDISDEDAKQFFDENKERFVIPASVKVGMIWISKGQSESDLVKYKALADEAYNALINGAEFTEIAKQYSQDYYASTGGVVPQWIYEGDLLPELNDIVFSLEVDGVSAPIEFQDGYYIFKVNEKEESKQQSYEELEAAIKSHLKDEAHIELETQLEEKMLSEANFVLYQRTIKTLLDETTKSSV